MTQEQRSRRPSSDRPPSARNDRRRSGLDGASVALQTLDDAEPSLGEVKFDEWFETPVFESEPDERLEELATSRRGPMRLAASTFLRLNARADQMRRRGEEPRQAPAAEIPAPIADSADTTEIPAVAPAPAPSRRARPKTGAGPARTAGAPAGRRTTTPAPARTNATAPARAKTAARTNASAPARAKAPARTPAAAPGQARPASRKASTAPTPVQVGIEVELDRPNRPQPVTRPAPAAAAVPTHPQTAHAPTAHARTTHARGGAPAAGPDGLRRRFNAALDRWAEREAATQVRIERLLLPKRWQA